MQTIALIALAFEASAIEVTTAPGQLSSQVTDYSVTQLTVSGEMDARDFAFIANELRQLTSLDLSAASIVAYDDSRQPLTGEAYRFEAGTLPKMLLMGSRLENIVLPESLIAIGTAALAGCEQLTSVEIPSAVTTIGDYAFSGSGLTAITIPATVTSVGKGAFAHCFALTSAVVGSVHIGNYAFVGDYRLQALQLGEQVRHIGIEAFHGTGVQSLDASGATLLDSVGAWSLASTPITTLSLPIQLARIGEGAFFDSRSLSAVQLPAGLTEIPDYAFAGGSLVTADSVLHEGVTRIGDYAFYNWNQATKFFIPGTVTHLGTRAMAGMIGLEQIDVAATSVPSLGDSVWAGLDQPSVKLNTPDNSVANLYAVATQWQDFHILRDYLLGDVNGDGVVNVIDINLITNYLLGKNPSPFIVEAADVDSSSRIDVSDNNGVINIMLGRVGQTVVRRIRGNDEMPAGARTDDQLTIGDFSIKPGESRTLEVMLNNSQDYAAMQFDITLPAGLEMVANSVRSTGRSAQHMHAMRTEGATTRVVTYSMQAADFVNSDAAIITLTVRAVDEVAPDATIMLHNVMFAQNMGKGFYGAESYTAVTNTTGVDNLAADNSRAYAMGMTLVIEASEACTVQLVSLNGMVQTFGVPQGRSEWPDLGHGIYVVRMQGKSYKVSLQ